MAISCVYIRQTQENSVLLNAHKALIICVLLFKQNSTVYGNFAIWKRIFQALVYFKFTQNNYRTNAGVRAAFADKPHTYESSL